MDVIIEFLTGYGYWGMLLAAFLAGSFFPFSSEAVMVGLMAAGLDPWLLMVYGTVGNVLGSVLSNRRTCGVLSASCMVMVPGWASSPSYRC